MMPNKTIYVADDDLPLYQHAQELAGGSLSAAIALALRRFVEVEEAREGGNETITLQVGSGAGHKVRFSGVLLGEWSRSTGQQLEVFQVYRTRTGKFALHVRRSPEWNWMLEAEIKRGSGGWLGYLGLDPRRWGLTEGEASLEVVSSLAELRGKIPGEFYDLIAAAPDRPTVEDLDI